MMNKYKERSTIRIDRRTADRQRQTTLFPDRIDELLQEFIGSGEVDRPPFRRRTSRQSIGNSGFSDRRDFSNRTADTFT
jgi:hypothetical protein